MIAVTVDAVMSMKTTMVAKHKMKDLLMIHVILGCEVLYDEVTGDYSMNQRHEVIDLVYKYVNDGGARVLVIDHLGELEYRRQCQKASSLLHCGVASCLKKVLAHTPSGICQSGSYGCLSLYAVMFC